jgi:hypothetical protein
MLAGTGFRFVAAGDNVPAGSVASPATGWIPVRAFVLALALMLGGCSASELVQNWSNAPASDLSQPNYRRLVATSIKGMFPNATLGEVEISGVRLVDHLRGQVWRTCVKLNARVNPQLYAIFILDGAIIDSRVGLVVDQCGKETYEPIDLNAKPGA